MTDRMQSLELVPLDQITILNPRSRDRRKHREIVANIEAIGLKRPITVSRRETPEGRRYDLVCGQGRLEALRLLGTTEAPAVVIEASETDCLVMSLVENMARPKHRAIDLLREIGNLRQRGYSNRAIAAKIGASESYVKAIGTLLAHGEERLLAAVESELIPIGLAIEIARSDSATAQDLLMAAYSEGQVKGRKLNAIRRMLGRRQRNGRNPADGDPGAGTTAGLTADQLVQRYEREAEKQRLLVKKLVLTQSLLLFVEQALKDLLADESFVSLLVAEQLATIPQGLALRVTGEQT